LNCEVAMKKTLLICAGITAIVLAAFAARLHAYDDPNTPPPVDDKIRASYSACQSYVANFSSQGCLGDKAIFDQQFGPPSRVNTSVTNQDDTMADYNFDAFTRITLQCSDGVSSASCYPKY
jgi:hypothetical protein